MARQPRPPIELTVSTYSFARWREKQGKSLEDTFDRVADLGLKAVEISGLDEKAKANPLRRAEQLRRHADRRGLGICSYCVAAELLRPAEEQRTAVQRLLQEIEVAAILGVGTFRHDITRGWDERAKSLRLRPTFAHALKVVTPAIRAIADAGASRGIRTSLENHGFYMQASRRVEQLLQAVAHRNFGLTMDMGNFLCVNENPVKAVARLARYAIHVHVKDFHVRLKSRMPPTGWFVTPTPIALRGAICGHGVIDIPAQLNLLRKARYRGYLSLEFEGMEEPLEAVRLGLEYLQTVLRR